MHIIRAERVNWSAPSPWQELAIGIIRQAAEDYRAWNRLLIRCDDPQKRALIEGKLQEIRRFFLGSWFSDLSGDADGEMILSRLDQEVEAFD